MIMLVAGSPFLCDNRFMDDRITVNSENSSEMPTIRGTRIMVRNVLGMVAGGVGVEGIRRAHPELSADDIKGALAWSTPKARWMRSRSLRDSAPETKWPVSLMMVHAARIRIRKHNKS